MKALIQEIQVALQAPLPGAAAQYQMAHLVRPHVPEPPADARVACVMALLFPRDATWQLTLIQRQARNPNDVHGGQIGFPGGKQEPEDPSLQHTALREVEEEIGVSGSSIEVIGRLSQLYIPISNFLVHPFVGYVETEPKFVLQEEEVAGILHVPFDYLRDPSIRKRATLTVANQFTLEHVPYFDLQGHVLWGATAMMLNELLQVLTMRNN